MDYKKRGIIYNIEKNSTVARYTIDYTKLEIASYFSVYNPANNKDIISNSMSAFFIKWSNLCVIAIENCELNYVDVLGPNEIVIEHSQQIELQYNSMGNVFIKADYINSADISYLTSITDWSNYYIKINDGYCANDIYRILGYNNDYKIFTIKESLNNNIQSGDTAYIIQKYYGKYRWEHLSVFTYTELVNYLNTKVEKGFIPTEFISFTYPEHINKEIYGQSVKYIVLEDNKLKYIKDNYYYKEANEYNKLSLLKNIQEKVTNIIKPSQNNNLPDMSFWITDVNKINKIYIDDKANDASNLLNINNITHNIDEQYIILHYLNDLIEIDKQYYVEFSSGNIFKGYGISTKEIKISWNNNIINERIKENIHNIFSINSLKKEIPFLKTLTLQNNFIEINTNDKLSLQRINYSDSPNNNLEAVFMWENNQQVVKIRDKTTLHVFETLILSLSDLEKDKYIVRHNHGGIFYKWTFDIITKDMKLLPINADTIRVVDPNDSNIIYKTITLSEHDNEPLFIFYNDGYYIYLINKHYGYKFDYVHNINDIILYKKLLDDEINDIFVKNTNESKDFAILHTTISDYKKYSFDFNINSNIYNKYIKNFKMDIKISALNKITTKHHLFTKIHVHKPSHTAWFAHGAGISSKYNGISNFVWIKTIKNNNDFFSNYWVNIPIQLFYGLYNDLQKSNPAWNTGMYGNETVFCSLDLEWYSGWSFIIFYINMYLKIKNLFATKESFMYLKNDIIYLGNKFIINYDVTVEKNSSIKVCIIDCYDEHSRKNKGNYGGGNWTKHYTEYYYYIITYNIYNNITSLNNTASLYNSYKQVVLNNNYDILLKNISSENVNILSNYIQDPLYTKNTIIYYNFEREDDYYVTDVYKELTTNNGIIDTRYAYWLYHGDNQDHWWNNDYTKLQTNQRLRMYFINEHYPFYENINIYKFPFNTFIPQESYALFQSRMIESENPSEVIVETLQSKPLKITIKQNFKIKYNGNYYTWNNNDYEQEINETGNFFVLATINYENNIIEHFEIKYIDELHNIKDNQLIIKIINRN